MGKINSVSFKNIKITDGFWEKRKKINSEKTIYAVWERFKDTGRFESLNFNWKEGEPNKPHIFWDSDVAKWIESVAFILEEKEDDVLEKAADDAIDLIETHQEENGYFNIYFTVVEPENRFKKRSEHELYDAGHLIEAAVAYYNATGKDKFLKIVCKYADLIEKVFVVDKSAAFITPGHEEIELALIKLYHVTHEKRYLDLSAFFVNNRGIGEEPFANHDFTSPKYSQSHLPVREQTLAEGHSVRAVYLYSAMADLAYELDDKELFKAAKILFENIAYKRMYITGGIGSSAKGEAFTVDYDLPNLTAYTESCAAIGLALFAKRMLKLEVNSLYSDITERIIYNGFLSSVSLDGISFFYENPLEVDPRLKLKDVSVGDFKTSFPPNQRSEVFDCSCCPPNITRFLASIADLLYTYNKNTLFVHHYMNSQGTITENNITITQKTNYPSSGNITLTVSNTNGYSIAIRKPYWCKNYSVNNNKHYEIKNGYIYIPCDSDEITLEIYFEMTCELIESSPYIQDNSGRVALCRGPIVYALESVDNFANLRDIHIYKELNCSIQVDENLGVEIIKSKGYRRDINKFNSLYQPISENFIDVELKFIPYYAFANRGESEMIVWILK